MGGNKSAEWLVTLNSVEKHALTWGIPWISMLAAFLNAVVFFLCVIIYSKTNGTRSNKPAFVFICVLSFSEVIYSSALFLAAEQYVPNHGRDLQAYIFVFPIMSLGFATCLLVTWKDESSICMRLSGITN